MVRDLSEVGFVVCAVGRDPRLCSGMVSVGQGVWKRKKNGEIVNVSASTWYHGSNDCI